MRILVVGLNYAPEPTGIAPYTSAFCRGLMRRGHQVRVLTTMPHYPEWRIREGYPEWRRRDVIDGVPVFRLRHYVPADPSGVRRLLSECSFGLRVALSLWGRPDMVVFVSPALISSAIAIIGRVPRQPYVVWVQDVYSSGLKEMGRRRGDVAVAAVHLLESHLLRHATGVAVIHQRFADVVRRMGAEASRVVVIRNWSHLLDRQPDAGHLVRRRLGVPVGTVMVLHSGAIGRKQDLDNVVAAARLAHRRNEAVHFLLVGDGSERTRLEEAAIDVPTIRFLDPLPKEQFQDALAAAEVLLVNEHSGLREMAVPSKLTSYFSSGRPVVAATDAESVTAEELRSSGAGIRVDPGQPAQLLDAVLRLGADPARAAQYGDAGRRYQQTVLSEETALDRFTAWLEALFEAEGRSSWIDRLRARSTRRRSGRSGSAG